MKKYFLMTWATMAMLCACNNFELPIENITSSKAPVFTASIDGANTRTMLEGNKLKWENGDEVMLLFEGGGVYLPIYQATPLEDASFATLTIKDGEYFDPSAGAVLFYALSPSSIFNKENFSFVFPATQVYVGDGKIPYAPMVYVNLGPNPIPESIEFKNFGALLKITVPSSEMASVRSITVSSNLALNGEYTLDFSSGCMAIVNPYILTNDNHSLTLDCYSKSGANVSIPSGGSKTFYVSILQFVEGSDGHPEYYDYLKIEVSDGVTTKTMRTNKTDGITIKRNMIYPITFAENKKTTTTGTEKRKGDVDVSWVQLWENGPRFATCNVGATAPKESGGFYSWGGIIDRASSLPIAYYTESSMLTSKYDTATNLWGGNWRMPTSEELQALLDNCDVVWTTVNDQKGRKFTGRGSYASNSIFLPAAGYSYVGGLHAVNEIGYYQSSTPDEPDGYGYKKAFHLVFDESDTRIPSGGRVDGLNVRAVLAE